MYMRRIVGHWRTLNNRTAIAIAIVQRLPRSGTSLRQRRDGVGGRDPASARLVGGERAGGDHRTHFIHAGLIADAVARLRQRRASASR
jgi:hypothetical protein